jgi:alpha-tubulin suppressor-like RCC1 family protein
MHIPNIRADRIVSIACGEMHTLLLTDDGLVWSFGNAEDGRLGHGTAHNELFPKIVARLRGKRVVQIDAGARHSAAVTADGLLYTWGRSDCGQLGIAGVESSYFPRVVSEPFVKEQKFVTRVSCGTNHTLIVTSANLLYACGSNSCGQLGIAKGRELMRVDIPQLVKWSRHKKIISLSCGDEHSACIDQTGVVYTWGNGFLGQLMNADFSDRHVPTPIYLSQDTYSNVGGSSVEFPPIYSTSGSVADMSVMSASPANAGGSGSPGGADGSTVQHRSSLASAAGGTDGYSRPSSSGSHGASRAKTPGGGVRFQNISSAPRFALVACGYAHTIVVTEDGLPFVSGWNEYGQLGLGHRRNIAIPTRISALDGRKITDAAGGYKHSVVLTDECKVFVVCLEFVILTDVVLVLTLFMAVVTDVLGYIAVLDGRQHVWTAWPWQAANQAVL